MQYEHGVSKRTVEVDGLKLAQGIFYGRTPPNLKDTKTRRVYGSFHTRAQHNAEHLKNEVKPDYVLAGAFQDGELVLEWDGSPVFGEDYVKKNAVGRVVQHPNRRFTIEWTKKSRKS